ncbi:hypothetical protein I4F81_012787 [Pyropia yezoensis]|uniref:Uncharacterized protein n=1 Tax=Pyropia yezoensis TaxID=2788 RepID=A0ACC3CJT0_PYRYE|nr:hypothetical protein I4F81_012787 [Neopyropia yezoensis]
MSAAAGAAAASADWETKKVEAVARATARRVEGAMAAGRRGGTARKDLRPFLTLNKRIAAALASPPFIGAHWAAHASEAERVEALAAATGRGDRRLVRALLVYGGLGGGGARAFGLRYAAATADAGLLGELLATGAGGRLDEPGGELALGNAAAAGRAANVDLLLRAGAAVGARGGGALVAACLGRHERVVRSLVLAGGDAAAAAQVAASRGWAAGERAIAAAVAERDAAQGGGGGGGVDGGGQVYAV